MRTNGSRGSWRCSPTRRGRAVHRRGGPIKKIGGLSVRETTFKLAVRGTSLLIILIVLWALGFLRTGPNVVQ